MSEILKSWALGLCAVSLLSAAAQAAVGKGRQTAALRLVEAMAAALVLLVPLRTVRIVLPDLGSDLSDSLSAVQADADRLTARQVEIYIENEAAARGLSCTAQAACETADGVFYLHALRLHYALDAACEEKAAFAQAMAQAFGLDPEKIVEA